MKRYIITMLTVLVCSIGMTAKEDKTTDNLSQWAESELAKYPESVDGIKVFYPSLDENGKLSVSDIIDIPDNTQTGIFTKALVYIYDNYDPETEVIESIDYDSRRFIIARKMKQGSSGKTTSYEYISAFQIADGLMSFISYDIRAEYREKGILPRKLDIEKLKPQENPRHKELVEEFSFLNAKFLKEMTDFISSSDSEKVTHWDEIKNNQAVKGMNKTEVKLALGRPYSERDMGKRTKWMYDNNSVIIFTNGIVTTVID